MEVDDLIKGNDGQVYVAHDISASCQLYLLDIHSEQYKVKDLLVATAIYSIRSLPITNNTSQQKTATTETTHVCQVTFAASRARQRMKQWSGVLVPVLEHLKTKLG